MQFHSSVYYRQLPLVLILASFIAVGCGKKEGGPEEAGTIKNTWKKVDLPPGADPSVADSMGGEGFEKIAEGLGFQTYTPIKSDTQLLIYPVYKGGEIKNTISRFPLSFRPFFYGPSANFTENSHMSSLVYENLLGIHPVTLDFVPQLASHWKISDDQMTFTFRINPDARWADGKRVTAQDVVATFKLIMDESIQSPSLQQSYKRYSVPVALSPYIVQVTCTERNWRNFMSFAASLTILQADEIGNLTGREFVDKFQFTMPIGSGPYIILPEDIEKQQSYSFTRRPDWWQAESLFTKSSCNFDKITFIVVVDNPTLEYEKFKKGEVDYFSYTSLTTDKWIGDTAFPAIKNNWIQRYRVFTDGPAGTWGYFFNLRKPPFNDIKVRKAISYLLDRKSIISKLLFNEYVPVDSWEGNSVYEFPGNEKVQYDPERAAALLAEAGWKTRNADGILVKNGQPFVIELPIIKILEQFVTPFKETAREAGIDVQIKYVDGNTLSENMMERNFSMSIGNYGGLVFPNPESSLDGDLADKKQTNNITGFKDAYVDQLIDQYAVTFNQADRIKIIQKIDSIVCERRLVALWWTPKGIRVANWNKFGMPPGILGKVTQVGDQDLPIITGWWIDPEKESALKEAMKSNSAVKGSNNVIENKFWKTYKH